MESFKDYKTLDLEMLSEWQDDLKTTSQVTSKHNLG